MTPEQEAALRAFIDAKPDWHTGFFIRCGNGVDYNVFKNGAGAELAWVTIYPHGGSRGGQRRDFHSESEFLLWIVTQMEEGA